MTKQVKSRQRVVDHGEVFTAEREVEAMCDLVKQETERIDSRFLEPACGDGNFLSVVLKRKLATVKKKYKRSACDWERNSLLTLGSLYGIDILPDNVTACRERLFEIWDSAYKLACKSECGDETRKAAQFILRRNIVCGNALTLLCVDREGCELDLPIVFSAWTFPFSDARMQRKDYTLAELLAAAGQADRSEKIGQTGQTLPLANDAGEAVQTFLRQYITHYRHIDEDDARWEETHRIQAVNEGNTNDGKRPFQSCVTPRQGFETLQFDVIISNPPYQISDGSGLGAGAVPIYDKFVMQAEKLKPRYLSMIIPARWFGGGRGLDKFRKHMITDRHIRELHDFWNASDCFAGVEIKGGICYFLWDRDDPGKCKVVTHSGEKTVVQKDRYLQEENSDVFIRYAEGVAIYHKVRALGEKTMDGSVSVQRPFGLRTYVHGKKEPFLNSVKIYERGGVGYIDEKDVTRNRSWIDLPKVYISAAYNAGDTYPHQILGKPIAGEAGSVCTETYVVVGPYAANSEVENVISYIQTKFFRFLVMLKKTSQHAAASVYSFVPVQDFSKSWTDEELYKKYGLNEAEIAFIDSMIRPMDLKEHG